MAEVDKEADVLCNLCTERERCRQGSKPWPNVMVDQMVKDATRALEVVADKSWVPWVECLIPNVSHQVRVEVATRACEEHNSRIWEEVECIMQEKATRVAWWEKWLEEKLMALLAKFKEDLEAEEMVEVEESGAVGMEEVRTTGGTQLSVMEVNNGEDEVVVVVEVRQGEMHKQASSSLPKTLRKRVCAAMVTQLLVRSQVQGSLVQGSQVGVGNVGSTGKMCERRIKHQIVCVVVRGGARCENCWAKHYGHSLMPVKEVVGGRGGPSGSQQVRVVAGSQMKGGDKEGKKAHHSWSVPYSSWPHHH